jgi:aromatic-L-amino-acid/L-tryptophan decarboxylase
MDKETFRKTGYAFIDWLADYFEQVEGLPVKAKVEPGEILYQLPEAPPVAGEPMDVLFSDFKSIIMPGITHWQHPGWFAYFPANNSPESVLAELLTAGLGAQCMIWQTSPAAAELEERVMDWLGQMLGLPSHMKGVIQDTASTATLCALLSAREKATAFASNKSGVRQPLRVYASREAHSSIEKGVKVAGYGKDNLCYIDTDEAYAMMPEKLEAAILKDIDCGLVPACVVATLGSTSSMAMDPVDAIAAICEKYSIWLHVDAAFAGTAAIIPEYREFMRGVGQADSFVFNPHKWMLTNFDCSAYFVKDPETLIQTFGINPEYLKTAADGQVKNYRDWGIQLGRRFRALKLWFVIRSYGLEGLQQMVRDHVDLARQFATWVEAEPGFELTAPPQLSLVCFRYNPGTLTEEELTDINRRLLDTVNADGSVYLTHTVLNGKYSIRMAVGQANTKLKHVKKTWELLLAARR